MIFSVCLTVKPVGEPDAGNPHVRFDERGWETERCRMAELPRPSSTLPTPPTGAMQPADGARHDHENGWNALERPNIQRAAGVQAVMNAGKFGMLTARMVAIPALNARQEEDQPPA